MVWKPPQMQKTDRRNTGKLPRHKMLLEGNQSSLIPDLFLSALSYTRPFVFSIACSRTKPVHIQQPSPEEDLGKAAPTIGLLFWETCLVAIIKTYHLKKSKEHQPENSTEIHLPAKWQGIPRCACWSYSCILQVWKQKTDVSYTVKYENTLRKVLSQGYKLYEKRLCTAWENTLNWQCFL